MLRAEGMTAVAATGVLRTAEEDAEDAGGKEGATYSLATTGLLGGVDACLLLAVTGLTVCGRVGRIQVVDLVL